MTHAAERDDATGTAATHRACAASTPRAQGIKGALRFEARVRVLAQGGTTSAEQRRRSPCAAADAVTLLVAAATSYKSYKDVGGDPEALTQARRSRLRREIRSTRCSRRTSPSISGCSAASPSISAPAPPRRVPTDERIRDFAQGRRSAARRAVLPVRALPADLELAPGTQPANLQGDLERSDEAAVGQQVHDQHQHRDELLAGGIDQPGRAGRAAHRAGPGPRRDRRAHGARSITARAAGSRTTTPICGARPAPIDGPHPACGRPAARGSASTSGSTTSSRGDRAFLARALPGDEGRVASSSSTRWSRSRRTSGWSPSPSAVAGEPPSVRRHDAVVAGPAMDTQILARSVRRTRSRAAEILGRRSPICARSSPPRARGSRRARSARPVSSRNGSTTGTCRRRTCTTATSRTCTRCIPSEQITLRGTPALAAAARKSLEIRGDDATGWGLGWRLNLWARLQDGSTRTASSNGLLRPGPHLSEHVRRAPAVPDRRQLRRHRRHRGDAAAEPRRRIELLPAPAEGVADRRGQRAARARRLRGRHQLEEREGSSPRDSARWSGNTIRLRYGSQTRAITLAEGQQYQW